MYVILVIVRSDPLPVGEGIIFIPDWAAGMNTDILDFHKCTICTLQILIIVLIAPRLLGFTHRGIFHYS